jgi:arylsulfatase A-like enzyme
MLIQRDHSSITNIIILSIIYPPGDHMICHTSLGVRRAAMVAAVFVFLSISSAVAGERVKPKKRPNVVVIVADDLGYGDLGFQGGKDIPTPHLDALAASGVRFSCAYVTGPICGPSRAAIMSGQYQQRHSYDGNPGPQEGLNLKVVTLAAAFKFGKYKTGAIGKWHLGSLPKYRPQMRGFDEFFGFYGAMHSYLPGAVDPSARMVFERTRKERAAGDKKFLPLPNLEGFGEGTGVAPGKLIRGSPTRPEQEVDEAGYLTEAFAREAEDFIGRHKTEPFFLYVAFNASHSPLQPPQKYLDRFPKLKGKRKAYAATTSALDDAVGRIVAKLRELGLEENTLIYFTNDNGGAIDDIAASNGPLGGAKFSLWEGGVRVPSLVTWKGAIPAKKVIDAPVSSLDIYPTVLAAARMDGPKGQTLDGMNLLPVLQGKAPMADLERRTLYWRFNPLWAIRSEKWKLTFPEHGEKLQLFDLSKDLGENNDLSAEHPKIVARLTADWRAWNEKNLPVKTEGPLKKSIP